MQPVFLQLGISLLLGLLVGVERQRVPGAVAGLRTFPLIAVLGTVCALLAEAHHESWILAAGLLGVAAIVVLGHWLRLREVEPDHGTTTNVAELLMFAVGALLTVEGMTAVAVAVGGGMAVLLQFKGELHGLARRLGDADLRAIMRFVLITCIILPVLPNQTYGPLDVLNPFEIWLIVVLIVGMSLGAYIAYKFFGQSAGILLGGVLGGAISSTATTASFARQARGDLVAARGSTVVVLIASSVVYARLVVAISVVAPSFLSSTAAPLGVLAALTLAPALVLWRRERRQSAAMPECKNPTQLRSAMFFGAMYAGVLLALAAAEHYRDWFGAEGLYYVAAVSGLTDMDAITISTARMSLENPQIAAEGWRLLVVGLLSNMGFKLIIAGILGGWRFMARFAAGLTPAILGALAMLALSLT